VQVLDNIKSHAKEYPQAFEQVRARSTSTRRLGAEALCGQYEEAIKENPRAEGNSYQRLIIGGGKSFGMGVFFFFLGGGGGTPVGGGPGPKGDAKKHERRDLKENPKEHRRARGCRRLELPPRARLQERGGPS